VPKVESLPPAPATARCASGYMLGTPSIRRYSPPYGGSDNATGADNQQERPARVQRLAGILRDHTPDIRVNRMMRWSRLHGDMQGWRETRAPSAQCD
jgi:hypothetical protein